MNIKQLKHLMLGAISTSLIALSVFSVDSCKRKHKEHVAPINPEHIENSIVAFSLIGEDVKVSITDYKTDAGQIDLLFQKGYVLGKVRPEITVSQSAIINPASNTEIDLTNKDLNYIVTAGNGSTRTYKVVSNVIQDNENRIFSFELLPGNKGIIDQEAGTIDIHVPADTDISNLKPIITLYDESSKVFPTQDKEMDFNKIVNYLVTADNGDEKVYQVLVTIDPSTDVNIRSITALPLTSTYVFVPELNLWNDKIENAIISKTKPVDIEVSAHPKAKVDIKNDKNTWTIEVTAEDNKTKAVYTLVWKSNNTALDKIRGEDASKLNNGETLTLKYDAQNTVKDCEDVKLEDITFAEPGTKAILTELDDNHVWQIAVTAVDQKTLATYKVALDAKCGNSENRIQSFKISGQDASIDHTTGNITVVLAPGTNVTNVVPEIKLFDNTASINPTASAQNFNSNVQYTVTAPNGKTRTYTVYTTVTASTDVSLKSVAPTDATESYVFSNALFNTWSNGENIQITRTTKPAGFTATPNYTGASVQIIENPQGTWNIMVIAEDKTTTATYIITFISNDTKLKSIQVIDASSLQNGQTLTLSSGIEPVLSDIVFNTPGTTASIQNTTTIGLYRISVTAQDGKTTATYQTQWTNCASGETMADIKNKDNLQTKFCYKELSVTGKSNAKYAFIDRNLGATRVAASVSDVNKETVGWYYQFNTPLPSGDWTAIFTNSGTWNVDEFSQDQKANLGTYNILETPCQQIGSQWFSPSVADLDDLGPFNNNPNPILNNTTTAFNNLKTIPAGHRDGYLGTTSTSNLTNISGTNQLLELWTSDRKLLGSNYLINILSMGASYNVMGTGAGYYRAYNIRCMRKL
jgi:hypothetical protein